jgi:hypothetical protein
VEYKRQCGVIYADLASRASDLPEQYRLLASDIPDESRMDATLAICVAQLVLTASTEIIISMGKDAADAVDSIRPEVAKLSARAVTTYPVGRGRELTAERFLEHVRNALSHPVPNAKGDFPATGYATSNHPAGTVCALRLTDSYWMKDGKLHHLWRNKDRKRVQMNVDRFEEQWDCPGSLYVDRNSGGYFTVFSKDDGKKYAPFFTVELAIGELNELSRTLGDAYKLWIKTLDPPIVRAVLASHQF